MTEVGRYGILTPTEEEVLAHKVKNGDREAMDQLIKYNLRFVISIAKKYQNMGLGFDDLISEGNLGLIKAAQRYDPTRGFKFISFAVWWIRQAILMSLAEKRRVVRLPANYSAGILKVAQASDDLEQRLERLPTQEELAEYMEMDVEKIFDFQMNMHMSFSLDRENESEEDGGGSLLDVLEDKQIEAPDTAVVEASFQDEIKRLLSILPERENTILRFFFGLDTEAMTLDDIGTHLNLSRERVRQIKRKALQFLREKTDKRFRVYL